MCLFKHLALHFYKPPTERAARNANKRHPNKRIIKETESRKSKQKWPTNKTNQKCKWIKQRTETPLKSKPHASCKANKSWKTCSVLSGWHQYWYLFACPVPGRRFWMLCSPVGRISVESFPVLVWRELESNSFFIGVLFKVSSLLLFLSL